MLAVLRQTLQFIFTIFLPGSLIIAHPLLIIVIEYCANYNDLSQPRLKLCGKRNLPKIINLSSFIELLSAYIYIQFTQIFVSRHTSFAFHPSVFGNLWELSTPNSLSLAFEARDIQSNGCTSHFGLVELEPW